MKFVAAAYMLFAAFLADNVITFLNENKTATVAHIRADYRSVLTGYFDKSVQYQPAVRNNVGIEFKSVFYAFAGCIFLSGYFERYSLISFPNSSPFR